MRVFRFVGLVLFVFSCPMLMANEEPADNSKCDEESHCNNVDGTNKGAPKSLERTHRSWFETSDIQMKGGGGGFIPRLGWVDGAQFETVNHSTLGLRSLPNSVFFGGGRGFSWSKMGLRLGGGGWGGSAQSGRNNSGVFSKLSYGYGGFIPEFVTEKGPVDISFGCLIGGGAAVFKVEADKDDAQTLGKMTTTSFVLAPFVSLELPLFYFFRIGFSVDYLAAATQTTKIEGFDTISSELIPSKIDMSHFGVSLQLLWGAFK